MNTWWSTSLLSFLLVLLVPNTYGQAESPRSLYQAAYKALKNNDCKTAISYLEKYKTARAEELKKNQAFSERIDSQISRCRNPQSPGVILIAEAEPDLEVGGGASGGILGGVAGGVAQATSGLGLAGIVALT